MNTVDERGPDERLKKVEVNDRFVTFHLFDGRIVSVPLAWSPRLQQATLEQRQNFHIGRSRIGVRWPDLDEDLSGAGALRGTPAPRTSFLPPGESWTSQDIRRLRLRMGKTITAFAELLGVRRATASDWERGKKKVSPMGERLLNNLALRFGTGIRI